MPDATSQFLNYISSTWDQTIPLKTLWTLQFTSLPQVIRSVDTILAGTERTSSSIAKFPTNKNISDLSYSNFTASTLLAQKITFPSDGLGVSTTSNSNMGGLFGGYYSTQRENYNSIIDFIMRPWLIAATYKGLIEDSELSIKTDMIVSLYSKYDENTWAGRKNIRFEGVVPVNTPGDMINYESSVNSAIVKPVSLAFKRYYVLD